MEQRREDIEEYLIREGEPFAEGQLKNNINSDIDNFFDESLALDREVALSEFDWVRLQDEFKAYTGEELSHWEIFELADRADEAREIVEERNVRQSSMFYERARIGFTILKRRIRRTQLLDIVLGPEGFGDRAPDSSEAFREAMKENARKSAVTERDTEWHRVNSNIERINSEIDSLWGDYQSISMTGRFITLAAILGATILSVILPLVGLFLNVSGWVISVPSHLADLDLVLLSICWVLGLTVVFVRIFQIIREEQDDEEPDVEKPDATVNKHPLSEERSTQRLYDQEEIDTDGETIRYVNESVNPDAARPSLSED